MDKIDNVVKAIKSEYKLENNMECTRKRLEECVHDGKHLNMDKLASLVSSKDHEVRVLGAADINALFEHWNPKTKAFDGYEPNCGWEGEE